MAKRRTPDTMDPPVVDDGGSEESVKRPRNFLAVLACETCRSKKTRCDEDRPKCGLCKSLGVECNYGERRLTK